MDRNEQTQTETPIAVEMMAWSDEAEAALSKTIDSDQLDWMRKEVEKDISRVWKIDNGDLWAVIRCEWSEIVICCLEGKGLHRFMPYLISQAKKQGFKSIRCHTNRKGLIKVLERYGVTQREVVLGLDL